jgi:hypothetical protein
MAGKGEFLLHGLIGGASGAIAALVNMYVESTSLLTSVFLLLSAFATLSPRTANLTLPRK